MISPAGDLRQFLAQVLDPRGREGKRHPLSAILTAVVCAVICGANGYKPIAQWLHKQPVDFWHFLGFTRRPIRYGALRNLLMVLDPQSFEDALRAWLQSTSAPVTPSERLSAVAIDGKSLCGTGGIDQRAMMLIAAFEHHSATVLQQRAVPADTNEQKAALDLLKQLVLTGRVITADALHCQQETCQLITDSGGHYVIPVKDNQPTLLTAISSEFTAQGAAFSPLPTAATAG
ncbi:MAG: ISAs1 family transposase [Candidatus Saccharimonas sp.]|nr:ISAs1 family transposase [Planctomycetaceae bacterium]